MVTNILKDGTVKEDLTGHAVACEEVPQIYSLIERINNVSKSKRRDCKGRS